MPLSNTNRSGRILWLLQHRTLMHAEVPILRRLGFEVFVPKILPDGVRSAASTFEYDDSLTIPPEVLAILNGTDFYRAPLDDEVAGLLNAYFGAAIMIAFRGLHVNVLTRFRGAIIFRAFGAPQPDTYSAQLLGWDPSEASLILELRNRFWFGAGYPQLASAEVPLLAGREVLLPIALPNSFRDQYENSWVGGDPRILFLCADILTNSSNELQYRRFKKLFGDLPHVIVGGQTMSIDDPQVIGFVSDQELVELMRSCAVMVYPSHEPRHVQYHPVEASVIGLPVVFFHNSLLGELVQPPPAGSVADDDEARVLVEALLAGDDDVIDRVRRGGTAVAEQFSEVSAQRIWADSLESSGIVTAMRSSLAEDLVDFGSGDSDHLVDRDLMIVPGVPVDDSPIDLGVDLRRLNLSSSFDAVGGLTFPEEWGRWVVGPVATFHLAHPVSGSLELEVEGGTHDVNRGRPIEVRLGDASAEFRFDRWVETPETQIVALSPTQPTRLLTLTAPGVFVGPDTRPLGFGLTHLRLRRRPSALRRAARRLVRRLRAVPVPWGT